MQTRVIRTAAALRPSGEWEQPIPWPDAGRVEPAAPLRRPGQRPETHVYRAPAAPGRRPAARRRKKSLLPGALARLAVLALCGWALTLVLQAAAGALTEGVHRAGALLSIADAWGVDAAPAAGVLKVEPVLQNPALPNGCEAASLAALLGYAGVEADPVELAMEWIPRQEFSYSGPDRFGPDPEEAYAGDPTSASGGWYCFAPPVVEGANAYLAFVGSDLRAKDLTGATFAALEDRLAAGQPVAVWFTQDYEDPRLNESFTWTLPSGEQYTPYANLHCLVLAGVEGSDCLLADPLAGSTRVDKATFERIYTAMGSRALALG